MEQINAIIFYITAFTAIFTCWAVIFSKRIIHAVFYSIICFFCFGFLFFLLNAPFNGVVQMSVYGIALSILCTIAIMLTNYKNETSEKFKISPKFILASAGLIMISVSVITFIKETMNYEPSWDLYINSSHLLTSPDNTKQLASELLTHNLYSFELLGLYMLIVLIGIAVLLTFKGETK